MDHVGKDSLPQKERNFVVPVVERVQVLSSDGSFQVVSHDGDLVEPSEEIFGGRQVVHVPDSENVAIFIVLQGVLVYVEEEVTFCACEAGVHQTLVRLSWD